MYTELELEVAMDSSIKKLPDLRELEYFEWPLNPTRLQRAYDALSSVAGRSGLTHSLFRLRCNLKGCKHFE